MFAVSQHLQTLVSSLPPHSIPPEDVEKLVKETLERSQSGSSAENRRAQWEFLLRNEVLTLAESEGSFGDEPEPSYFENICSKLDLILAFSDQKAIDESFMVSLGVKEGTWVFGPSGVGPYPGTL